MNNLPEPTVSKQLMERVVVDGDLSQLTPEQRVNYYKAVCESMGLNPFTKPFGYITLNGKLTLYALKGAADQLRGINKVSIYKLEKESDGNLYSVTAYAKDKHGRTDADMGAVSVANLQGDKLANARMKAMTKAKRRVTLSICGLGWLDETEVETIPAAQYVEVSEEGEIVAEHPAQPIEVEPSDNGSNGKKLMAAAKFVDYCALELGYQGSDHIRHTMALLGLKTVPNDADKRKSLFEWLKKYRGYRDSGLSQDDTLVKIADEVE